MKTSTKIIASLALALTVLFACKKDTGVVAQPEEQTLAMNVQLSTARGATENAIVVGNKAELDAAFNTNKDYVIITKAAEKNNIFIPTTGTTGPVEPVDLYKLCWDEINAYVNANKPSWQAQANANCQTVYACVTCPNVGYGLFVMYAIKPNPIKCATVLAASAYYSKFDFKPGDYNSESVSAYITKK